MRKVLLLCLLSTTFAFFHACKDEKPLYHPDFNRILFKVKPGTYNAFSLPLMQRCNEWKEKGCFWIEEPKFIPNSTEFRIKCIPAHLLSTKETYLEITLVSRGEDEFIKNTRQVILYSDDMLFLSNKEVWDAQSVVDTLYTFLDRTRVK